MSLTSSVLHSGLPVQDHDDRRRTNVGIAIRGDQEPLSVWGDIVIVGADAALQSEKQLARKAGLRSGPGDVHRHHRRRRVVEELLAIAAPARILARPS